MHLVSLSFSTARKTLLLRADDTCELSEPAGADDPEAVRPAVAPRRDFKTDDRQRAPQFLG